MARRRPQYETDPDRRRELEFSRTVEEKFKCSFRKMPMQYGMDFAMFHQKGLVGYGEVKVRTNPVRQYPTYMLSMKKVHCANALHDLSGVPCFLFVRWTDRWGSVELNKIAGSVEVANGGRTDRGDPQDVEPVAYIPLSLFSFY